MTPRDFFSFFKTKSGKLVLFGLVFAGGLMLFSVLRDKAGSEADELKSIQTLYYVTRAYLTIEPAARRCTWFCQRPAMLRAHAPWYAGGAPPRPARGKLP